MKKIIDFIARIKKLIQIKRANMRLAHAIRLAEKAHAEHKDRFYVMPDHRDRLIIMRRRSMRILRRRHYMDSSVRMSNMLQESFYFTADRGECGGLTPGQKELKRLMYLEYAANKQ